MEIEEELKETKRELEELGVPSSGSLQSPPAGGNNSQEIRLPSLGKLVSEFAKEVSEVIKDKNELFFRTNTREVIEIGKVIEDKDKDTEIEYTGFITITPKRFVTLVEKYFTPMIEKSNMLYPSSMKVETASIVLSSSIIEDSLPKIKRIFTIPIPIMFKDKLEFPKKGYDSRFKSWLARDSPEITEPNMELEEAKGIVNDILKEFCFKDEHDRTNAIAGLLTPYLRGLYSGFNARTPVFFYQANRERVGKDYLAGITGLVYEGKVLEEPPISTGERGNNNEELKKKILSAMIGGKKRMHFSNNKGHINNSVFESVITAPVWGDRVLGKSKDLEFNNEIEFSLSGNVGITYTADLSLRCRHINQFYAEEDINSRSFERRDLHNWVLSNRNKILSALYCLVKNWVSKGSRQGSIPFSSFPEWARVCGGVMESAGYDSPCTVDKNTAGIGGDNETADMKELFEYCYGTYPNEGLNKAKIRDVAKEEDLFNYLDLNDKSDKIKFGKILQRFVGRKFENSENVLIEMAIINPSEKRTARQSLTFRKVEL